MLQIPIRIRYVTLLTVNIHFRTPQENWHKYPAWLLLCMHEIIAPVIALSAIAMKILMKKEVNRYLYGNSVHPLGSLGDNNPNNNNNPNPNPDNNPNKNPRIIITPSED